MKILLATHVFHPLTGGIETMSAAFADEFMRQGHEVRVVTQTPNPALDDYPFEVVRRPSPATLLSLTRWCDVFFHNNISLRTLWPLLFVRRPWVVAHRTWIAREDGTRGWQDHIKRFTCRYAANIANSQAVADSLPCPARVIGNCYRDDVFRPMPEVARGADLAFVGRLVSDKGADTLIEALGLLRERGLAPRLTVVGEGPERDGLERLARDLHVEDSVEFAGRRTGEDLARLLNAHRVLVVPSRWAEPFGIVALEGIACGCVVVGSEGGGLKDAIGDCGVTFPNGDARALSEALRELLTCPGKLAAYRNAAGSHLAGRTQDVVAQAYLEVFQQARHGGPRGPGSHGPKGRFS